jgi:hypothetical protein
MELTGVEANHIIAALLLLESHIQSQNTPKLVRDTACYGGVEMMTIAQIDELMHRLTAHFEKEQIYGQRTYDTGQTVLPPQRF